MSMPQTPATRKSKVRKAQTIAARRHADRCRRLLRRDRRAAERTTYRIRVKVVRFYRACRSQMREMHALVRTRAHFATVTMPLSDSTIRRWHRLVTKAGFNALRPQSRRPHSCPTRIPFPLVEVIVMLRWWYGWGGHRIAAEVRARGLGTVSGATVYRILRRYDRPIQVYALKGRADGIAYRRYATARPNAQWHMDFTQITLADGQVVWIAVILDDCSRTLMAVTAGLHATTAWATDVLITTLGAWGVPAEMVTDNGRAFTSVWTDRPTQFEQTLADHGIAHRRCAPYYPQGNGKVEAMNKTLKRELLAHLSAPTLADLQAELSAFQTYYNHYRLHSALGWQVPITRYSSRAVRCEGLAALPRLDMATNPRWGHAVCDPPLTITPSLATHAYAIVPWQAPIRC